MRARLVVLTALLLLTPVLAQEAGDGSDVPREPKDDERDARDNQTRQNETDRPNQTDRPTDRPNDRANQTNRPDQARGDPKFEPGARRSGDHIHVALHNDTLYYGVDDTRWFSVAAPNASLEKGERQWVVTIDNGTFRFSDTATGHMSYRGSPIALDFGDARLQEQRYGSTIHKGEHTAVLLETGHRNQFISFRIQEDRDAQPPEAAPAHVEVAQAVREKRVAATITDDEVETFDDVIVEVQAPVQATRDTPYKVVIGAELEEGRTIVLDVNRSILTGPDLELRYFDINDDGTETEVVFRQADDLEDILEPTDDAGQPEYWIVEDENGLQVMVSIPHWSTHAVTLASIGSFVQPQVWLGASVGALISVLAAVAILRPRQEE